MGREGDDSAARTAPTKLSETPLVAASAELRDCALGRYTEIAAGARMMNVVFGDYSYTDRFAEIDNAEIGKFVSIAAFTRINPGDHPMERASQHHFMYRSSFYWADAADEPEIFARRAAKRVVVGPDVWIGGHAVILAGRAMGAGAVLGAGSVLTKDAGAYEIWAGAPARKIRDRFAPAIKERLLALAWWDWDHGRLRRALSDFRGLSIEAFLERYEAPPEPL